MHFTFISVLPPQQIDISELVPSARVKAISLDISI